MESVVSSEVRVEAGKAAAVVVARGVQKRYGEGDTAVEAVRSTERDVLDAREELSRA